MSSRPKTRSPKRPFLFVNVAMTADGKIAFSRENFTPFSSRRDHEQMMKLRATADAVICGARTIEVTQTILGNGEKKYDRMRQENGLADFNVRVVVSGSGTIDPASPIFQKHFSPIVVLTTKRISIANLKKLRAVADAVKICGTKGINFPSALAWLRRRWKIKRLLCEGGGELNDALFRASLVDEIHLTICPQIFGGGNAPTISDGIGFPKLAQAQEFELKSLKNFKGELFTVFKRR